jgi:hypothetical protein
MTKPKPATTVTEYAVQLLHECLPYMEVAAGRSTGRSPKAIAADIVTLFGTGPGQPGQHAPTVAELRQLRRAWRAYLEDEQQGYPLLAEAIRVVLGNPKTAVRLALESAGKISLLDLPRRDRAFGDTVQAVPISRAYLLTQAEVDDAPLANAALDAATAKVLEAEG